MCFHMLALGCFLGIPLTMHELAEDSAELKKGKKHRKQQAFLDYSREPEVAGLQKATSTREPENYKHRPHHQGPREVDPNTIEDKSLLKRYPKADFSTGATSVPNSSPLTGERKEKSKRN